MSTAPHSFLLALLLLTACRSGPAPSADELRTLWRKGSSDSESATAVVREAANVAERSHQRSARVHELIAAERVRTDEEKVLAALVLIDSDDEADLELARNLALEAAENGADEGFPVAANAIDRMLYLQGKPQRFGTQYVYVPVLSRWKLHEVDPRTTDEERAAYGVPPLAVIEARTEELNEALPDRR